MASIGQQPSVHNKTQRISIIDNNRSKEQIIKVEQE